MAIKYNAKDASSAWPAGDYDAVILAVEETTSKSSGSDMYKVTLEAFNPEGRKQTIYDYIVIPAATFKLKMVASALGKSADFNAGKFDLTAYQNRRLTLTLDQVEDAQYGDKNTVKKYLAPQGGVSAPAPSSNGSIAGKLREKAAANVGASPISEDKQFEEEQIPF